ncbi:pheromone receptor [Favolaschia claudopus]|uniref:Pheromone receptor n=1 Tax=Favolaschia claudopus TaxID=2862362 RepID=A0AAW0BXS7_9AGAR
MSPRLLFPAILSFLLAALLAVFLVILLRRPTVNLANLALVFWLLLGNVIHAVNALVWMSDADTTRIPIWCDIVTKLLLGISAALPGVCLCSARYLELLASTRKIYPNTYSKRLHALLDIALCYVLPLLYMILHFAVQDHRFDLLQNFGCSASIHRSTPAVLIMTIPLLILCSISLVLCMLSFIHTFRLSPSTFSTHLAARSSSSLSRPVYLRRLFKSTLLISTVLIVTLFQILLGPRSANSTSFQQPEFTAIHVVKNTDEVGAAQTMWWAIPLVSMVYLLLSVVLGEETVDLFGWVARRMQRGDSGKRPELSRLTFPRTMQSKSSLLTPTSTPSNLAAPRPAQLRSGWDDMLDLNARNRSTSKARAFPFPPATTQRKSILSPASRCSSPSPSSSTPSPTTPEAEEDASFTESTLSYLASPIAQALGLESPVSPSSAALSISPVRSSPTSTVVLLKTPPAPKSTTRPRAEIHVSPPLSHAALPLSHPHLPLPPAPTTCPPSPPQKIQMPTQRPRHHPLLPPLTPPSPPAHAFSPPRQPIPEDTSSMISDSIIWDAPWPVPPASPIKLHSQARLLVPSPGVLKKPKLVLEVPRRVSSVATRKSVPAWNQEKERRYAPMEDVIYMTGTKMGGDEGYSVAVAV